MTSERGRDTVSAAGGVLVLADGRVALVHRPHRGDWSLPKGKLDASETFEQAAVREVEEETGLRCELGPALAPIHYRDHKDRLKEVRYWLMQLPATTEPPFEPNDEVDELRWLAPDEAVPLLSYERDQVLLEHAAQVLGS